MVIMICVALIVLPTQVSFFFFSFVSVRIFFRWKLSELKQEKYSLNISLNALKG